MRKLLLTFVALSLLGTAWATNQETLTFKKGKNQLQVENITQNGFEFNVSLSEAILKDADSKKGNFFTLHSHGYTKSFNLGNPNLPSKTRMIEVPHGAKVKINILSKKTETISLKDYGFDGKLFPCQPSMAKCDDGKENKFHMNEKVYASNKFFANELVKFEESGIMRGTRLGTIAVNPFSYNPVTGELTVVTDLHVEVSFVDADWAKTEEMQAIYGNSSFNQLLSKSLNHRTEGKPLNQSEPVKMIVIADRMFETSLQPFVEWKNMSGIETTVRYTDETEVGSTTTSIQSFLQDLYDAATTEDPAPSFLLLVGDIAQVPAFSGDAGSHVTDLYYVCYDGPDDMIPDVNHGRFSAQTVAELDAMIEKTMLYEKYEMADPSYLDNTFLVAGDDAGHEMVHGNGAIRYIEENYLNADHGIDNLQMYQNPPISNAAYSDSIIANVNRGIAWGNYTAHCGPSGWGTPSFTTSDVHSLTNDGKYGVLIGNCCLSNKFDEDECFGEALLRAENKGAIGYMGGSNSTYWDEDYWWAVGNGTPVEYPEYENFGNGCYDLMFHEHPDDQPYSDWTPAAGQINIAGNLAVEESSSSMKLYYWEIYHLMGDPSLIPYAGIPSEITPSYLSTIPVGMSSLSLTSLPEYARVTLSNEGTVLATTVADASGAATLEFDAIANPMTADLVIIGQFHQPYIGTLEVVPGDEPFVTLNQTTIVDDGNGMADYGEDIELSVNMKNVAAEGSGYDAANVEVTISTDDPYITITDDTESYGTIAAGDSTTIESGFALSISDTIPDQYVATINFNMTGDDAKYSWDATYSLVVNAPVIKIESVTLSNDDDENGRLDPGEMADLIFTVKNNGHADANEVVNQLTADNMYLTIMENTITSPITAEGYIEVAFQLAASDGAPQGTPVSLELNAEQSIYADAFTENIVIGQPPEITVGTGTTTVSYYPFYTYYENNRSQMLYLGSELGAGEINIQQISFDITEIGSPLNLQNFSIKVLETDLTEMGSDYVDMSSAQEVLAATEYSMPGAAGWHAFDVDDFVFNATENNLIVEITWGDNGEWDSPFSVNASTTDFVSVAYGYADGETPPDYDGSSSDRPNIMFNIEGDAPGTEYEATFNVTDGTDVVEDATVFIGTMGQNVDVNGQSIFTLYEGSYYYSVEAPGYEAITNEAITLTEDVTIDVALGPDNINSINTANLKLYPNPNDGSFTVSVDGTYQVTVFSTIGSVVYTGVVDNKANINLQNTSPGIYFIKLQDGKEVTTKRFVIE